MAQDVTEQANAFVPLFQVEGKLSELWTALGGPGAIRTRTSNVVVVLPDLQHLDPTLELFQAVAGRYPTRVVLLVPDPNAPEPGIAARVHLLRPSEGSPNQCVEVIELHATPEAWLHVAEAVLVCLLPELPVYLWWRMPLDPDAPLFRALEPLVDMLVLDAGDVPEPETTVLALVGVCHRFPWGCNDVVWARVVPWREHLAQLFDPIDRRPLLRSLDRISMSVAATATGTAAALYITAWLANRLQWKPLSRWRTGARSRELRFQGPEREVRVVINRSQAAHHSPVSRIRLHASGILPAAFTVALVEETAQVEVTVEMGQTRVRQVHLMGSTDTAHALAETLSFAGKDWLFAETLQTAAQLLNPPGED